ncbi:MAG: ATP phosphoribosyltransferase [Slackia sp.]|nr:ATP phosphoribosyltransferase [Slackia sp.]
MKPVCPRGFRDIMPEEALRRERIIRTVSDAFARRGYLPVETPLLEDRRSIERAACVEDAAFQLFDSDGRLLMVRSDLTMPIARLVATRLEHASAPFRLRYAAPIVRDQARFMGRSRQFTQLGIELIGEKGPAADIEVLSAAADALDAAGVPGWRIVCGSVKPMKDLLAALPLSQDRRAAVLERVHASDLVGIDELARRFDLSDQERRSLSGLCRIGGDATCLSRARELLAACDADDAGVTELEGVLSAARALGLAEKIGVDFSVMNSFDYYTGLVFGVYARGLPGAIGSGGRYDDAFSRLGGEGLPAAGFALSLEQIEESLSLDAAGKRPPLRVAVPKGSLFADTLAALERAGLDVDELRDPGRRLIVHAGEVDFVIVRPSDAPAFVASGGADCGICGNDSLIEAGLDAVQLVDLGYGACRFVVAESVAAAGAADTRYARFGNIRVCTKYPRIAQAYYDRIGMQADIVTLHGNIELGPMVGMADRIVDITATGTTLRENGLTVVDDVIECSARFFANPASLRCDERVRRLAMALADTRKE